MAKRITGTQAKEPTFSVKALLKFEIAGERIEDDYRVHYRGLSSKVLREMFIDPEGEEVTDENRNAVAEQLATLIMCIDDIVDIDEETEEATHSVIDVAFLDGLTLENLKSINDAIKNDINPPKATPVS